MEQADNLLLRIQKYDKTFSKGQKRLAAYVLKNYDKAVFLTASKLGKEVGVSESTTVRFATQLGYKGFPEFHRALEELVRNKLNSIQRMKVTYGPCTGSRDPGYGVSVRYRDHQADDGTYRSCGI